jgi:hypothetical protein
MEKCRRLAYATTSKAEAAEYINGGVDYNRAYNWVTLAQYRLGLDHHPCEDAA